jgi:molybdenum cofactor cytidylyltransferase
MNVAGIVLAAGGSSRMGRNKILFRFGGETLLRRCARTALEAGLDPVLVVLGHEAALAETELSGLPCRTVVNTAWAKGMNTSLDAGIGAVSAASDAAVVLLADMPCVDAAMIRAVVARSADGASPLVASRYGDVLAPPTLYRRTLFPELRGGEGDGRGREVVRRHGQEAAFVDWPPSALADVDVPEDLERAKARLGGEEEV